MTAAALSPRCGAGQAVPRGPCDGGGGGGQRAQHDDGMHMAPKRARVRTHHKHDPAPHLDSVGTHSRPRAPSHYTHNTGPRHESWRSAPRLRVTIPRLCVCVCVCVCCVLGKGHVPIPRQHPMRPSGVTAPQCAREPPRGQRRQIAARFPSRSRGHRLRRVRGTSKKGSAEKEIDDSMMKSKINYFIPS